MDQERFGTVAAPVVPTPIAWRYGQRAVFGERAKWLPPYRLVPSFASADGKTAVYRRRSQVALTESTDAATAAQQGTTIKMGDGRAARQPPARRPAAVADDVMKP